MVDDARLQELLSESRKAKKEDKEMAEALSSMMKTRGWAFYMHLLGAHIQSFSDVMLQPAGSLDALVSGEFVKGAMYGLVLARDRPSVIVESMKQVLASDQDDEETVR